MYLDETNDGKVRLITKFLEQDKCMQLVTFLLKYDEKMRCAEYKFYKSDQAETLEENNEELLDLAALHAKLKGGGDLFHRLGAIIGYICMNSKRCHTMILQALKTKESGIGGKTFILFIDTNTCITLSLINKILFGCTYVRTYVLQLLRQH